MVNVELCEVLVSELVNEIDADAGETATQWQFLCVIRKSGRKALTVVTIGDDSTDRLLSFLDQQKEAGNDKVIWRKNC